MNDEQEGNRPDAQAQEPQRNWVVRGIAYIKCKFEERCAENQKENSTDRAARRTANATYVIAFFTAVTVGVGYFQWRALHSTDDATHKAANAALRSAKVAEQALLLTQRPIISLREFKYMTNRAETGTITGIKVTAFLENAGLTAAVNVRGHNSISVRPDFPADFNYPDIGPKILASPIGPKQISLGVNELSLEELSLIRTGARKALVWGWYEYNDLFEGTKTHRTEYAARILVFGDPANSRGDVTIQPYGPHNCIDKNCFREPGATIPTIPNS